jgi:hypothetical protein
MVVVVDTQAFMRYWKKDSYHRKNYSILRCKVVWIATQLYMCRFPFLETYSLLLYRLGFLAAKEFTEYCLGCVEFFKSNPEDYLQAKKKSHAVSRSDDYSIVDATTAVLSAK